VRKKNGEYDLAVDNFNRPLLVLARSTTDKNSIVKQLQKIVVYGNNKNNAAPPFIQAI